LPAPAHAPARHGAADPRRRRAHRRPRPRLRRPLLPRPAAEVAGVSAPAADPGPEPRPATKLRLGGMALRNGLLVHGPAHWAAAVRAADGSIRTASGRKPRATGFVVSIPGARGVISLGEAMAVFQLVKRALP